MNGFCLFVHFPSIFLSPRVLLIIYLSGHMNAFRQGRALGTYLIVGVNSDESITACKGTHQACNQANQVFSNSI